MKGAKNRLVQETVLQIFRGFYEATEPDREILNTDPNDFDLDPGPFYETLVSYFGIEWDALVSSAHGSRSGCGQRVGSLPRCAHRG